MIKAINTPSIDDESRQPVAATGRRRLDSRLIVALASGSEVCHVAVALAVSERTIYRRLRDKTFRRRVLRGGSLAHPDALYLESFARLDSSPLDARYLIGFRVATVPEPSSLILAAAGLLGLAAWGWRRKRAK